MTALLPYLLLTVYSVSAGGVRDGVAALPAADGVPGEGSHVAWSS